MNLCHCGLENVLAISVFRSLESNNSLKELDLSWNRRLAENDSEAVGYALERMLNMNKALEVLHLCGCRVTEQMAKHILTGVTKNTSLLKLNIEQCILSGSCAVSLLQQVTLHSTLSRVHVSEVDVMGVGKVKMEGKIIWCVVGDTISERCVEFFRALNDSYLKVSEMYVRDLTDQTAENFALGLAESQTLKEMKLSPSFWEKQNIGSTGVVYIFKSLEYNTSLEELDLSGNSQLAEADSEAVGCAIERMLNVNRTLEVLNLADCEFTSEVVSYFANGLTQNHSVRKVILHSNSIGSTGAVNIFRSLEHNTSLEELDLSGNSQLAGGDSEAVGCAIERMLNVNRTLRVLNLKNCILDTTVVTHTAAGLAHNASLVELNIGGNSLLFSINHITSEGWVHLFNALCNNTSLKKLDSSYSYLGMEESVALAEMLSCNKSLTELDLKWCDPPEAGLREIARGLLQNTSLKKLDISCNKPGMEGSVALAEMLSCNKSLTELDLKSCDIPEAGLREIARGLLQNTSLQKLDISCSKLGMEGSVALAEMMSCNKSLTELNLSLCDNPEAGLREIARGLLQNTSLQTLNLWSTEQKAFLEAEIERLKKSGNFTLQSSSRLEIK